MKLLSKSSGNAELERRLVKAEEERDREKARAQRYKQFFVLYCKKNGKPAEKNSRPDMDDEADDDDEDEPEVAIDPEVKKFQRRAQKEINQLPENKVKLDGKRLIIEQPSNESSIEVQHKSARKKTDKISRK
jgi:hypothetical protein